MNSIEFAGDSDIRWYTLMIQFFIALNSIHLVRIARSAIHVQTSFTRITQISSVEVSYGAKQECVNHCETCFKTINWNEEMSWIMLLTVAIVSQGLKEVCRFIVLSGQHVTLCPTIPSHVSGDNLESRAQLRKIRVSFSAWGGNMTVDWGLKHCFLNRTTAGLTTSWNLNALNDQTVLPWCHNQNQNRYI